MQANEEQHEAVAPDVFPGVLLDLSLLSPFTDHVAYKMWNDVEV